MTNKEKKTGTTVGTDIPDGHTDTIKTQDTLIEKKLAEFDERYGAFEFCHEVRKFNRDRFVAFLTSAIEEAQEQTEAHMSKIEQLRCEETWKKVWTNDQVQDSITQAIEAERERIVGVVEGMKRLTNDLKMSVNPCTFFTDHEPVWDGNYYTCAKCGQEFIKTKELNNALTDLTTKLKEDYK